jgi:hypothetical protein
MPSPRKAADPERSRREALESFLFATTAAVSESVLCRDLNMTVNELSVAKASLVAMDRILVDSSGKLRYRHTTSCNSGILRFLMRLDPPDTPPSLKRVRC